MTDPKMPEETAGGPLGKLAGKAKEAAGSVLGNEELAREGRLQQAQAEAEAEAAQADAEAQQRQAETEVEAAKADNELERERLQTELAAEEREAAIDRDEHERVREATTRAEQEKAAAERERRLQQSAATEDRATSRGRAAGRRTGGDPPQAGSTSLRSESQRDRPRGDKMSLRTISRSAVGGYIKLLRLPLDAAVGLRTRNGGMALREGPSPSTVSKHACGASPAGRWATKNWCGTPSAGGWPRMSASGPAALRAEAQGGSELAEERLSEKEEKAEQQRRQAARRAAERKKRAEQHVKRRAAGSPVSSHGAGAQTRRPRPQGGGNRGSLEARPASAARRGGRCAGEKAGCADREERGPAPAPAASKTKAARKRGRA